MIIARHFPPIMTFSTCNNDIFQVNDSLSLAITGSLAEEMTSAEETLDYLGIPTLS
ncbi:MAG: hypothetical protein ACREBR_02915 [bacterium]